jgi:hypothetical protein
VVEEIIKNAVSRRNNQVALLNFDSVIICHFWFVLAQTLFTLPEDLAQADALLHLASLPEYFAVFFGRQIC